MRTTSLVAAALALLPVLVGCLPPRQVLLPAVGLPVPALRDFPAGFEPPRSAETGQPMPGFGGEVDAGSSRTLYRTPVIFVHGNTVSARYWLPAREFFLHRGYRRDELWAFSYGWDHVHYFDSNDLSVPSVERMVASVMDYLSKQRGVPVHQVDIVAHSLGVTLVRQWMRQTNSFHKVRSFVGIAGANHGVWTSSGFPRGSSRVVSWELAPDSPWLAQLNRDGETPGATRYLTLYDGSGWGDVLFPKPWQDSSALAGAENLPYNRERGTWFDHLELGERPETLGEVLKFLAGGHEPLPQARPPRVLRTGDHLRADPAGARLHCAAGGEYPGFASPALDHVELVPGTLLTCFARAAVSGLSSPMFRFTAGRVAAAGAGEPVLSAVPAGGAHAQAQSVRLESSDPSAFITYTTSGTPPSSGSPLYRAEHPVYVAGPLRLQAVAITPDGRQSKPLVLDFDISLEKEEAESTWQRQLDPATPEAYEGRRRKGH